MARRRGLGPRLRPKVGPPPRGLEFDGMIEEMRERAVDLIGKVGAPRDKPIPSRDPPTPKGGRRAADENVGWRTRSASESRRRLCPMQAISAWQRSAQCTTSKSPRSPSSTPRASSTPSPPAGPSARRKSPPERFGVRTVRSTRKRGDTIPMQTRQSAFESYHNRHATSGRRVPIRRLLGCYRWSA